MAVIKLADEELLSILCERFDISKEGAELMPFNVSTDGMTTLTFFGAGHNKREKESKGILHLKVEAL